MRCNKAFRRSIRLLITIILPLGAYAAPAPASPANRPRPGLVRVQMDTAEGSIVVALDARHAPKTTANFLAYVDDGRFDGTTFYRASRRKSDPKLGMIQGGIGTDARRSLPPVAHESTAMTGIHHLDGAISMARGGDPGTAMGNFFITIGPTPHMDANGAYPGYAAFGYVVAGMDTVRRILAKPTGGGVGVMRGQMIVNRVRLIRARRLDGTSRPTTAVKPWLIDMSRMKRPNGPPPRDRVNPGR